MRLTLAQNHSFPDYNAAAANILRIKAKTTLRPIIVTLVKRSSYIITRLFPIAMEVLQQSGHALHPQLQGELDSVFRSFVKRVTDHCREHMEAEFESLTKVIDQNLLQQAIAIPDE